jgi:GT2 family glycosyltransferase
VSEFRPWRVVHVDLAARLPDLPRDEGGGGAFVIFWASGLPLGEALFVESQLPLTPDQLADVAASAVAETVAFRLTTGGFEPSLPMPGWLNDSLKERPALSELLAIRDPLKELAAKTADDAAPIDVSVIICTRDRPEPLEACLCAIAACRGPVREIVVVDNAPTTSATRDVAARFPGVRYVLEPRAGLSRARNAGLRATSGEIVAFTDDDVIVQPEWAARLARAFDAPDVASVTGLVLPASLATESEWLFERAFGGFGRGYRRMRYDQTFFSAARRKGAPVWQIGAGANMALRRSALERVGDFDVRLGAGAAGCSEDSELWYRLLTAGYACVYEPAAVVHHHHRASLSDLRHQMRMYTRGHVTALLAQFERHRHWGNIYRILLAMPWYYTRLFLRDSLGVWPNPQPMLGAQVRGAIDGIGYYFAHRRDGNGA